MSGAPGLRTAGAADRDLCSLACRTNNWSPPTCLFSAPLITPSQTRRRPSSQTTPRRPCSGASPASRNVPRTSWTGFRGRPASAPRSRPSKAIRVPDGPLHTPLGRVPLAYPNPPEMQRGTGWQWTPTRATRADTGPRTPPISPTTARPMQKRVSGNVPQWPCAPKRASIP